MESSYCLMQNVNRIRLNQEMRIVAIVSFLTVINIFTFDMNFLSITLSVIQTLIVFYFILVGDIEKMILSFIIFASCSLESTFFITSRTDTVIYSFLNLPFVHYYHLFVVLLIAFLGVYRKKNVIVFNRKKNILVLIALLFYILEFLVTCITWLFNDNNVQAIGIRYIIKDMYNTYYVLMTILVLLGCKEKNHNFVYKLEMTVSGTFIGLTITAIIAVLLRKVNMLSPTNPILISPSSFFYAPILLMVYFRKGRTLRYLFFGFVSILIQMKYSLGIPGAWLLLVMICVFVFLFNFMKSVLCGQKDIKLLLVIILCSLPIVFFLIVNNIVHINNEYIVYKINTIKKLFDFSKGGQQWISNTGDSISIRIETMINIFIEYYEKPWFILSGKGFGGSILKYYGFAMWNNFGSSFPDEMIARGVFSQFHAQFLELLINFGFMGVMFTYFTIKLIVKEIGDIHINAWKVGALFWLFILPWEFRSMIIGSCFVSLSLCSKNDLVGCIVKNNI